MEESYDRRKFSSSIGAKVFGRTIKVEGILLQFCRAACCRWLAALKRAPSCRGGFAAVTRGRATGRWFAKLRNPVIEVVNQAGGLTFITADNSFASVSGELKARCVYCGVERSPLSSSLSLSFFFSHFKRRVLFIAVTAINFAMVVLGHGETWKGGIHDRFN